MSREQSKGSNGEGRSLRKLLEQSWDYTLAESLEERTEIHLGIVSTMINTLRMKVNIAILGQRYILRVF